MAQGVKRTVLNGVPYDYRADQYLVVSLDFPVIIRPDRPRSPGWPSATRRRSAATSMTPIQFAKQIRLQEARALLMTQPAHVAEIGYLVGYESPSQFSREYRKTFGTPPGQDAARRGVPQHR
jgi:hypothetical protein